MFNLMDELNVICIFYIYCTTCVCVCVLCVIFLRTERWGWFPSPFSYTVTWRGNDYSRFDNGLFLHFIFCKKYIPPDHKLECGWNRLHAGAHMREMVADVCFLCDTIVVLPAEVMDTLKA